MSSIAKVIEVIAQSEQSFEHAVQEALNETAKTIDNIQEIWVSSMKAVVKDNRIVEYRVAAKVTFLVSGRG